MFAKSFNAKRNSKKKPKNDNLTVNEDIEQTSNNSTKENSSDNSQSDQENGLSVEYSSQESGIEKKEEHGVSAQDALNNFINEKSTVGHPFDTHNNSDTSSHAFGYGVNRRQKKNVHDKKPRRNVHNNYNSDTPTSSIINKTRGGSNRRSDDPSKNSSNTRSAIIVPTKEDIFNLAGPQHAEESKLLFSEDSSEEFPREEKNVSESTSKFPERNSETAKIGQDASMSLNPRILNADYLLTTDTSVNMSPSTVRKEKILMQMPVEARHKLNFYGSIQDDMGGKQLFTDNVDGLLHLSMDSHSVADKNPLLKNVSPDQKRKGGYYCADNETPTKKSFGRVQKHGASQNNKRLPFTDTFSESKSGQNFSSTSESSEYSMYNGTEKIGKEKKDQDYIVFQYNPDKKTLTEKTEKLRTHQKRLRKETPIVQEDYEQIGHEKKIGGPFDILQNGGTHQFQNWPFTLEDVPSADGTINPLTGQITRLSDQPNIPFGPDWIRERIARRLAFLSDPIYRFVARTAGVVNSRIETFWKAPETSFQTSGRRGGQVQGLFSGIFQDGRSATGRTEIFTEKKEDEIFKNDRELTNLQSALSVQQQRRKELQDRIDFENRIRQWPENTILNINGEQINVTSERKEEAERIIQGLQPTLNSVVSQIKDLQQRMRTRQSILIKAINRQTSLGRLINRANPQDQFVRSWLNFLDQLSQSLDPAAQSFVDALQKATQDEFAKRQGQVSSNGGFLPPASTATPDRIEARRLWIQLPENLGVFFWDNIFDSALQQAYAGILQVAKKQILLYDLMTQDNVSARFSQLVGEYIRYARARDSTRFTTNQNMKIITNNIKRLIQWFKFVNYADDWTLVYFGRNPYKSQILQMRRAVLEEQSRGPDYTDREPTKREQEGLMVLDF